MVSRGELIEIGDRFRLPDLLACTGAALREVGTTNRTTAADYAQATGPRTAFILKVHPSNFRIEGFTAAVGVPVLAELGVPVVGGGGAPGVELPSAAISLPEELAVPLRGGTLPVVGRVEAGRLLLDLRSVPPEADEPLARATLAAASSGLS